ncbi:MAG TPA: septal ring lytic transglycosylase RlpA family protein [Thermoanaerobaculia bacterium]|nr:septal ring lytic transglycosylase RlpA family protein [Thermoanaerobaculia bacterium]
MPRGRGRSAPRRARRGALGRRRRGEGLRHRLGRAPVFQVGALLLASALLPSCSARPGAKSAGDLAGEGVERGLASWYGADFAGLPTASGEIFDPGRISAAHRALPLGTVVDVTNERNGRTVRVRINDRGPFIAGRIVDLSRAAAEEIGSVVDGVVPVTLTVVSLGTGRRTALVRNETGGVAAATSWAVQAGAFASEENAARLKERLAERYPKVWLEPFDGLTRVKFGPYSSPEEADSARDSLADLGLAGIVVPHR